MLENCSDDPSDLAEISKATCNTIFWRLFFCTLLSSFVFGFQSMHIPRGRLWGAFTSLGQLCKFLHAHVCGAFAQRFDWGDDIFQFVAGRFSEGSDQNLRLSHRFGFSACAFSLLGCMGAACHRRFEIRFPFLVAKCRQMQPVRGHQRQPQVTRRPPEGRQKDARRPLAGQQMIVRWPAECR